MPQIRRLARRRRTKRALLTVAHRVLITIYHVSRYKHPFHDLRGDYFNMLDAVRLEHNHV